MRLNQFDYFRAIAIIFIVAGHCINEIIEINGFIPNILVNFVTGSSALFVFISGFFFHHIFYKKFEYKDFMVKKVKNVLCPYIFFTTITMMLYLYIKIKELNQFDNTNIIFNQILDTHNWLDIFRLYVWSLLLGKISAPYWYVPFIMLIFLISPIFNFFIKLSSNVRLNVIIICLLISMVVHRPAFNLNPFQAVIYYLPIYLIGIACSINRLEIETRLKGKALILLLMIILLTIIQSQLLIADNNLTHIDNQTNVTVEVLIIQKIFLCFFFLSLLNKLQNKEIKILKLISSASFAIFFLHYGVYKIMYALGLFAIFNFLPSIIVWLITIIIVTAVSILIAYLIKLAFKNNSKYLVGW